jgi:hypothetical protein
MPKRIKSKPPPLFSIFWPQYGETVVTHIVPCLRKKRGGGTISSSLYRGTVAMGIVTLARPSLLGSIVPTVMMTSPTPVATDE